MENQEDLLRLIREHEQKIHSIVNGREQRVVDERNRIQAEIDALNKGREERRKQFEIDSIKRQSELARVKEKHRQLKADMDRNVPFVERFKRVVFDYLNLKKQIEADTDLTETEKESKLTELEKDFERRKSLLGGGLCKSLLYLSKSKISSMRI